MISAEEWAGDDILVVVRFADASASHKTRCNTT
jgi:hypothetical protein